MLKKLLTLIVVALGVVMVLATRQPDSFAVQRSATIKATPEKLFGMVQDFHEWAKWSPWEALDPEMKRSFEGPATGVGSRYGWEGNSEVGKGSMEIVDATAPSRIGIKLDFIEPFESKADVLFAFTPEGDSTKVTWSMAGSNNFMSKIMCVFMNMDTMIGGDYEKGLANLKTLAEK